MLPATGDCAEIVALVLAAAALAVEVFAAQVVELVLVLAVELIVVRAAEAPALSSHQIVSIEFLLYSLFRLEAQGVEWILKPAS